MMPRSSLAGILRNPVLLGVPAVAFVFIFAIWPIADFLRESFVSGNGISLQQYRVLANSSTFAVVMARTLVTAVSVTFACVVLAYPMAYALTKARGGTRTVLIGLVALPYLTSVIVRTYAWAAILSLNGPVNSAMVALGLFDEPILLGHSSFGTWVGMTHILLPIATLTLWSAMQKIDPMQRLVAESLGASKAEAFLTVFVPQSAPGLASVASLVYILALGAYVIPAMLGGTRGLLFAQLVVEEATSLLNWNLSGAMAMVMLLAAAVPAVMFSASRLVLQRLSTRKVVSPVQSLVSRLLCPVLNLLPDRAWTIGWRAVAAATLVFLLAPELVVIVVSFGPERQITFPPTSLTLAGYQHTLTSAAWLDPLRRSLLYASIDAVIATVLGVLAAYGFVRDGSRLARASTILLVAPVVLPEIVFAISYFIMANRWNLSGTGVGIVLGQAAGMIGLVVIMLTGIMRQVDPGLEDSAALCGASRARILVQIVLPLIAPGIVVALIYGFLHAFDNLVLPLFIAGTNTTVPVRMFLSMQDELTSSPAVIASILIAFLAIGLTIAARLERGTGIALPGFEGKR
jgi:putative spermidine/putrescine transport system permease protein